MSEEQIDLLDRLSEHPLPSPDVMPSSCEDAAGAQGVTPVFLTRADPSCNMHRFYGLELATSLFGECGVVRHWGRIGTSCRSRTDWFNELQEAEAAFLILRSAIYGGRMSVGEIVMDSSASALPVYSSRSQKRCMIR